MEHKYYYIGGVAFVGGYLFLRYKAASNSAPQTDTVSTDALNLSPGITYSSGGTGYYDSGADTGNSSVSLPVTDNSSTTSLADVIAQYLKTDATVKTNAQNIGLLTSLGLTPGQTATVTNTESGATVAVTPNTGNGWSKETLLEKARALAESAGYGGDKLNATGVTAAATSLGVTVNDIGSALGLNSQQTTEWMQTHQGVAPQSVKERTLEQIKKDGVTKLTSSYINDLSKKLGYTINQLGEVAGMNASQTAEWLKNN